MTMETVLKTDDGETSDLSDKTLREVCPDMSIETVTDDGDTRKLSDKCPHMTMGTAMSTDDGDSNDLSDKTLRELCLANHEARVHTLLYVVMTNINGHQVSGHVDLADRVAKVMVVLCCCCCIVGQHSNSTALQLYWKEGIKDKRWILPKSGDLTFKRRDQVNYCSSVNWDVVIKDNVIKLLHSRYKVFKV